MLCTYTLRLCAFLSVFLCVSCQWCLSLPKFFFLSSSSLPLRLRQILLCRQTFSAAAMATTTFHSQVSHLSLSLSLLLGRSSSNENPQRWPKCRIACFYYVSEYHLMLIVWNVSLRMER